MTGSFPECFVAHDARTHPETGMRSRTMARRSLLLGAICLAGGIAIGFLLRGGPPESEVRADEPKAQPRPAAPADDGKLRIIAFGAHPDDCELKVGGAAAKW